MYAIREVNKIVLRFEYPYNRRHSWPHGEYSEAKGLKFFTTLPIGFGENLAVKPRYRVLHVAEAYKRVLLYGELQRRDKLLGTSETDAKLNKIIGKEKTMR